MNVASKELCQELYELSGWGDKHDYEDDNLRWHPNVESLKKWDCPAYDLGYLLRKLPPEVRNGWFGLWKNAKGNYSCGYTTEDASIVDGNTAHELFEAADTPEDATAKLAIELFKQGILTPAPQDGSETKDPNFNGE